MNPSDRQHPGPLPLRQTEHVSAPQLKGGEFDEIYHDIQPSSKRITFRLVGRAVRRHWWQALLVWIVGSVGLAVVAYMKVKPTYFAFACVRVEPFDRGLFTQNNNNNIDFAEYKETQLNLMTSPTVLETAVAEHPELYQFPRLAKADDKIAELKSLLLVSIRPKTNLIEVAMTSESAIESAACVNAVVNAYLRNSSVNSNQETELKIQQLEEERSVKLREVEQKRSGVKQLTNKIGSVNVAEVKGRNSVSVEQYSQLSQQLLTVQLDIMKAEASLSHLQNEQNAPLPIAEEGPVTEDQLTELFYNHPRVVDVKAKFERADESYKTYASKVRDKSDPSLVRHTNTRRDAKSQLNQLWTQLRPTLMAQLRGGAARATGPGQSDPALKVAEINLAALKAQEASLNDKLNTLNIRQKEEGSEQITLEFEHEDLRRADKYLNTIEEHLAQIKFDNRNPVGRIRLEFSAKPSNRSSAGNRIKLMAMAPVGVMVGLLGLLVLLELHASRVVDPEDIPGRIHVPVIGVVPQLPQILSRGGERFSSRDEFRSQRQLDQFVQSLDHLRVALCSGRNAWGRERRCILITSAISSEGKTTLAAQLAERCVNAGLHTLLIDGDLRNPTLSRMLDVTSNRGLINVLRGEVEAEEAITIVGSAGGFSFMPAGTPRVDPSRLLHGDRLGKLLTAVRESYDIVIVDAPPVLPVPDALTMGRWCDGAVLAVRYDMSRFPLVEKANRRLASVGVSVIGAVVNGVRIPDSAYGSYYPSYAYSSDRANQTPLDV